MSDLSAYFRVGKTVVVDLNVPPLAKQILQRVSDITRVKDICTGGGFARGLYMQQRLGLNPQMNDIDIFADIAVEDFEAVKAPLEAEFGTPVRYHVGTFEKEEHARGLIEFAVPPSLRDKCAGAESVQFNFGAAHPWSNPYDYVIRANVGMNQIAIGKEGNVIASPSFMDDMTNRTMTMNADRHWTAHDWTRTTKSLERMVKERPEFKGWKTITVPRPHLPMTGAFWDTQQQIFLAPR